MLSERPERLHPVTDRSRCRVTHTNIRQSLGNFAQEREKDCRTEESQVYHKNTAHRTNLSRTRVSVEIREPVWV